MNDDGEQRLSSENSPVGWYVGSYLLRFVELNQVGKDDLGASFFGLGKHDHCPSAESRRGISKGGVGGQGARRALSGRPTRNPRPMDLRRAN